MRYGPLVAALLGIASLAGGAALRLHVDREVAACEARGSGFLDFCGSLRHIHEYVWGSVLLGAGALLVVGGLTWAAARARPTRQPEA